MFGLVSLSKYDSSIGILNTTWTQWRVSHELRSLQQQLQLRFGQLALSFPGRGEMPTI
jgi:hypothetical protein